MLYNASVVRTILWSFWKIYVTTVHLLLRFTVNVSYDGMIALPHLSTPILKVWGSALRTQCPLTTGIVRRQFPSLRGTTWRSNGKSAWNGSRFEHHIRLLRRDQWHSQSEIKNIAYYNVTNTELGLVRTERPIPGPNGLGIELPVPRALVHCDNKPLQNRT